MDAVVIIPLEIFPVVIVAVVTPAKVSMFAVPSTCKSFHSFPASPKLQKLSTSGIKLELTTPIEALSICATSSIKRFFHCWVSDPKLYVSSVAGIKDPLNCKIWVLLLIPVIEISLSKESIDKVSMWAVPST